jgi:hypothetical protein
MKSPQKYEEAKANETKTLGRDREVGYEFL